MTWLTCIKKGANAVNSEYLSQMGHGTLEDIAMKDDAFAGYPDYGSVRMVIRPGMWVRLSRNLDKDRGFVNGALGQVQELLRCGPRLAPIFTVRLTHGCMVVVHPIAHDDGRLFLPCVRLWIRHDYSEGAGCYLGRSGSLF